MALKMTWKAEASLMKPSDQSYVNLCVHVFIFQLIYYFHFCLVRNLFAQVKKFPIQNIKPFSSHDL